MTPGAYAYLAFGAALVAVFAAIVIHYFARGRRAKIEQVKYKMLDHDR